MWGVPSPAFSFTLSVRQVYKSSFPMFCSHLFSCSSRRKNLEISCRADQRLVLLIKNIQTPFSIRSKQHHKWDSCMMQFFLHGNLIHAYVHTLVKQKAAWHKNEKTKLQFPSQSWSLQWMLVTQAMQYWDQPSTNSLNAQCHFIGHEKAGSNPYNFFVKTLITTYISSFPFATPKVVKL